MPKVNVNDIEMYYEIHGEGDPLLLLHGFTGSGQLVAPMFHDYKPHFQLIIPDLRGHGRTNNPSIKFTAKQAANDITKLLDHLQIDKLKAMGVSSGGDILLHISTGQPNRITAMVLDSTGHYFPQQGREAASNYAPTDQTMELFRKIHHFGEEQIELIIKQMREFKDIYDDVNFTPPLLSTIKTKTLIISGDRDKYYPIEIAVEMYKHIPCSYLLVLPNTGHVAILSKYAEDVKKISLEFLLNKD